jgi:hypothetical protein
VRERRERGRSRRTRPDVSGAAPARPCPLGPARPLSFPVLGA